MYFVGVLPNQLTSSGGFVGVSIWTVSLVDCSFLSHKCVCLVVIAVQRTVYRSESRYPSTTHQYTGPYTIQPATACVQYRCVLNYFTCTHL